MTLDQLDDEVLKLKKEQFNLRFQRATGQLENTSRVRVIRRDIARMKTIAAQKRPGCRSRKRKLPPHPSRRPPKKAEVRQAEGCREAQSAAKRAPRPKTKSK